jgi:hypothetical protein
MQKLWNTFHIIPSDVKLQITCRKTNVLFGKTSYMYAELGKK